MLKRCFYFVIYDPQKHCRAPHCPGRLQKKCLDRTSSRDPRSVPSTVSTRAIWNQSQSFNPETQSSRISSPTAHQERPERVPREPNLRRGPGMPTLPPCQGQPHPPNDLMGFDFFSSGGGSRAWALVCSSLGRTVINYSRRQLSLPRVLSEGT